MFEAYTEASKRIFLVGRYEAVARGSSSLEVEHVVLGLFSAQRDLALRIFKTQETLDEARNRIVAELGQQAPSHSAPVSEGDLPLSKHCHSPEAVEKAVQAAARFLPSQSLVDGALDVMDEAGARVKLKREAVPPEIAEAKAKLRRVRKRKDHELTIQNYEALKSSTQEEETLREKLELLKSRHVPEQASQQVTAHDIVDVVAARTSLSNEAIEAALQQPLTRTALDAARNQLAAGIPIGRRDWIDGLLAYLSECSKEDADRLALSIQNARSTLVGT